MHSRFHKRKLELPLIPRIIRQWSIVHSGSKSLPCFIARDRQTALQQLVHNCFAADILVIEERMPCHVQKEPTSLLTNMSCLMEVNNHDLGSVPIQH